MKKVPAFTLLLAMLATSVGTVVASKTMDSVIESTATFLIRDWLTDPEFKGFNPPQVLTVNKGTKVFGACGSYIKGDEVAGSAYCPATNTIYLEPKQLKFFYDNFGYSSVAYVIAHEFGHAIQARYGDNAGGAEVELQADCLAGILIDIGSKELGVTRKETIQMAQAAYAIGDPTHGTGAQRSYALLSGMGVVKAGCSKKEMLALKNDQVKDPAYKRLMSTRSGTAGIDINKTPYPKSFGSVVNEL